jgi:ligand-binding SRPBCC domain-containing protein
MSRWITETEQVLSERVPAPPEQVRAFYVDLDNLKSLHPFLVSVERDGRQSAADGYVQSYRIRERIPLGPVTLPIRFRARLSVPLTGDVVADSWQFPRIWLHTVVSFEPEADGTLMTERIRFAAPRPLSRITVTEGVVAHRAMLAGIAEHFS